MNYKCYCKDFENIENYDKAKADNFKGWHLHHRLETHNSDGERRLVDITPEELIALDMYYNRPANELIFLTIKEHRCLHKAGKPHSSEHKRKISKALKGHHLSEETKKKISNALMRHSISEETKRKISETTRGKPHPHKGTKFGHLSEETKKKISETLKKSEAHKGLCWFNNGTKNIRAKECPEGFVPGRINYVRSSTLCE